MGVAQRFELGPLTNPIPASRTTPLPPADPQTAALILNLPSPARTRAAPRCRKACPWCRRQEHQIQGGGRDSGPGNAPSGAPLSERPCHNPARPSPSLSLRTDLVDGAQQLSKFHRLVQQLRLVLWASPFIPPPPLPQHVLPSPRAHRFVHSCHGNRTSGATYPSSPLAPTTPGNKHSGAIRPGEAPDYCVFKGPRLR